MNLEQSGSPFPQTLWTLVRCAAGGGVDSAERSAAVGRLVEVYWPAVYSYLRRLGRGREEAAEITQAFFADVALGRGLLAGADQGQGRLRSLLVAALKNYLVDRHRRAAVRGGGVTATVSAERVEYEEGLIAGMNGGRGGGAGGLGASGADGADAAFDRRWALAQVQEALARCERHFRSSGKPRHWVAFEARVVRPSIGLSEAPPMAELAAELGLESAADAAAAVQVVKKRFEALLREVIAETLGEGEDAEGEYGYVTGLLS